MVSIDVKAISPLVGTEGLEGIVLMTENGELILLKGSAVGMLLEMSAPVTKRQKRAMAKESYDEGVIPPNAINFPKPKKQGKNNGLWTRPTDCLICGNKFSSRGGAYTHVRNVHKRKPTPTLVKESS